MRWPGANLEEKHEPRGVSVAEAQNHDSMKSSGQNLTLAAIEKRSFASARSNGQRPIAAITLSQSPGSCSGKLSSIPTIGWPRLTATGNSEPRVPGSRAVDDSGPSAAGHRRISLRAPEPRSPRGGSSDVRAGLVNWDKFGSSSRQTTPAAERRMSAESTVR